MAARDARRPRIQFSLWSFIKAIFLGSVMMALFAAVLRESARPDSSAFLVYLALLFGFPVAWVVGSGLVGTLLESLARLRRDD